MGTSNIEWTEKTWNPTREYLRVSPGCENCYAERVAHRFSGPGLPYEGLVEMGKHGPRWNGKIRFVREVLQQPLSWRKPTKVFVDSMSDLFHEDVTDGQIMDVWRVMAACPQHTFQILTKRPARMVAWLAKYADALEADLEPKMARGPAEIRKLHTCGRALLWADMLDGWGDPPAGAAYPTYDWMNGPRAWPAVLRNVWLGVSVENQKYADERIPFLLKVSAAVRFISYEPALGPVDFVRTGAFGCSCDHPTRCFGTCPFYRVAQNNGKRIGWVIAGGESGPGARPCALEWLQSAREQCADAGVPFFCKQVGSYCVSEARAAESKEELHDLDPSRKWPEDRWLWRAGLADKKGGDFEQMPEDLRVREFPR